MKAKNYEFQTDKIKVYLKIGLLLCFRVSAIKFDATFILFPGLIMLLTDFEFILIFSSFFNLFMAFNI